MRITRKTLQQQNELLKAENAALLQAFNVSQAQWGAFVQGVAGRINGSLGADLGLALQSPSAPGILTGGVR